jgi:hypothetical protein
MTDTPTLAEFCHTCPFGKNRAGQRRNPDLADKIVGDINKNDPWPKCFEQPDFLCKGAQQHIVNLVHDLGMITSPTEESWREAWRKLISGKP